MLQPEAVPLSAYVHLPWCLQKCPYCDFNSHAAPAELAQSQYVDALLADLQSAANRHISRPLHSVFFGGGTPSLFNGDQIARILAALQTQFGFEPDIEVTLEANPGASDQSRFQAYRAAGVNRLSIGVQSFHGEHLKALGRVHDPDQALQAIAAARDAGFRRINADLMFGLPNQTLQACLSDVETALRSGVDHISAYQLTIEPNTWFARHPPVLPDDELRWQMQEALQQTLAEHGFLHYEVSAYAKPGTECRHNLNYWRFGDYVGIGAGAHGKATTADGIQRYSKPKHPTAYMTSPQSTTVTPVDPSHVLFEAMMNGLRLIDGITFDVLSERAGLTRAQLLATLAGLIEKDLLSADRTHLRATTQGQLFLNDILTELLPE